jgi:hypothetical protein
LSDSTFAACKVVKTWEHYYYKNANENIIDSMEFLYAFF